MTDTPRLQPEELDVEAIRSAAHYLRRHAPEPISARGPFLSAVQKLEDGAVDHKMLGRELLNYLEDKQCTHGEFGILQHFVNWIHSRQTLYGWPWYARPGE